MLLTALLSWVAFAELDESLYDGSSLLQTHGLIADDPEVLQSDQNVTVEGGEAQSLAYRQNVFTVSGPCGVSGSCVSSPNYPSDYANSDDCTITVASGTTLSMTEFNSESGYDYLYVNGNRHSGSSNPLGSNFVASQPIGWSADHSVARKGWQICEAGPPTRSLAAYPTPPTPFPTELMGCNGLITTRGTDSGGGNTIYFDRQTIPCRSYQGLTSWVLRRPSGGIGFQYRCCNVPQLSGCSARYTPTNDAGGGNPIYFDRHHLQCGTNQIMQTWRLRTRGSSRIYFQYTCCNVPQTSNCRNLATPWNDQGNSYYLDRHNVECTVNDEVLTSWRLTTSGRRMRIEYTCCSVTTPTPSPTPYPSVSPTESPTFFPTESPTLFPTESPTLFPTESPTFFPTESPTLFPTESPTLFPTESPTPFPTESPTPSPTDPAMPRQGPSQDGFPSQDMDSQVDFRGAIITDNNLGGQGPVAGNLSAMYFRGVTFDQTTDLIVSNLTEYVPWQPAVNGFASANGSSLAQISLKCGMGVTFRFTFVDSTTGEPKRLASFNFTVADLDLGTHGRCKESVEVADYAAYSLAADSAIRASVDPSVGIMRFRATEAGTQADNPVSLEGMSEEHKRKSISFLFTDTESFTVAFFTDTDVNSFSTDPGVVGYAGRRLLFGGAMS